LGRILSDLACACLKNGMSNLSGLSLSVDSRFSWMTSAHGWVLGSIG
jgi:hypothetical protein